MPLLWSCIFQLTAAFSIAPDGLSAGRRPNFHQPDDVLYGFPKGAMGPFVLSDDNDRLITFAGGNLRLATKHSCLLRESFTIDDVRAFRFQ